ncbi:MAG: hypothetical protein IJH50_10405 [Kiritimatiellae bacterium]|nr:hypothetical protein [Kiritimatiellia bacterium]
MGILFNVAGHAVKESFKRIFLETMARTAAIETAKALVTGIASAAKKLKRKIERWRLWEIESIEVTIEA